MAMTTPRTEAEIYRAAAKLLREKGWCQYFSKEEATGAICLSRALFEASGSPPNNPPPINPLIVSALMLATNGVTPIMFNDYQGRTKEQVLAALERAATLAASSP